MPDPCWETEMNQTWFAPRNSEKSVEVPADDQHWLRPWDQGTTEAWECHGGTHLLIGDDKRVWEWASAEESYPCLWPQLDGFLPFVLLPSIKLLFKTFYLPAPLKTGSTNEDAAFSNPPRHFSSLWAPGIMVKSLKSPKIALPSLYVRLIVERRLEIMYRSLYHTFLHIMLMHWWELLWWRCW